MFRDPGWRVNQPHVYAFSRFLKRDHRGAIPRTLRRCEIEDDFWIKGALSCINTPFVTKLLTSLRRGLLLTAFAAVLPGACVKADAVGDGGVSSPETGQIVDEPPWPDDLLSDFEDSTAAIVVRLGWPPRNGLWYTYNDASRTCMQTPKPASQVASGTKPPTYVGATPPSAASGPSGARALHAQWKGCTGWGAGIGADINAAMNLDGTVYMGPKVPYDLQSWAGVTFWAMALPNTDVNLRVVVPMRATLKIADGGACDEADAGAGRCGDNWGETVTLPANGNWARITVRFSDPGFRQLGTGAAIPFNPSDVTGFQIQSTDVNQTYDFWIDDVYLVR